MSNFTFQWEVVGVWLLIATVISVVTASLMWLRRDADRHGQPGLVWALATLLFAYPAGLLLWLVLRFIAKPHRMSSNS